jgi:AcrR family transcriptional regulator
MSDAAALAPPRTAPRRRDAAATRAAILEAAQAQFARLGYDRAALRDIAAEAGADVALIKRYFGGKEALFTEALKASIRAEPLKAWSRATFAHEVATMMAGLPDAKAGGGPHSHGQADHDETRAHSFQFLLRAATSPTTAPLLNLAVQERFLTPIREWLGDAQTADVQARARVLAGAFIGFLVERLIRNEPLHGRERAVFIERVTALFEALIGEG